MRPRSLLPTLLVLGTTGRARADDLPPALVARPATLPDGMIAMTLGGGYDSAHVLGISVRSETSLGLLVQRGMTPRLELSLGTGLVLHPDAGWSREGMFGLAYRAWQGDDVELAPSLTVPLSAKSGVDLTSTLVLGANLRWRVTPCVLLIFGSRLVPLPIRPAVAVDVGADATVVVQLAARWAAIGQARLGEVTLVGQTDRGAAPWHHLPAFARLVYATPAAIDIAFELHGDARDPHDEVGVALLVTRRQ